MGVLSTDIPAKQAFMQLRSALTGSKRSLGESSDSCIVNVLDKTRAIIEELVGARVIALEVLFPKRQAVRPLRVLQDLP